MRKAVPIDIATIIKQKELNQRQEDFINKLVEKGGSFTNKSLAEFWGASQLPSSLKKELLKSPPLLVIIQEKPIQEYRLVSKSELSDEQTGLLSSQSVSQQDKPLKAPSKINFKIQDLEERVKTLELNFNNLISPYKKINTKKFKSKLYHEYNYINPIGDISGIDYEILRRRVCRDLQISYDYFDDIIYDLQKTEHRITIQSGRKKKYIHIK